VTALYPFLLAAVRVLFPGGMRVRHARGPIDYVHVDESKVPPVILLQGDHGTQVHGFMTADPAESLTATAAWERSARSGHITFRTAAPRPLATA
jgi:hypothetical protein